MNFVGNDLMNNISKFYEALYGFIATAELLVYSYVYHQKHCFHLPN